MWVHSVEASPSLSVDIRSPELAPCGAPVVGNDGLWYVADCVTGVHQAPREIDGGQTRLAEAAQNARR